MSEAKTIYVVTSGEYSDYHIVGVFDSREKAEEYQKYSHEAEPNMIEEYGLNLLKPDKRDKLFKVYSEFDNVDFKVATCREGEWDLWEKDLVYISGENFLRTRFYISFTVLADTRERAIKIAAERLARVKAEEEVRFPFLRSKLPFKWNGRVREEYPTCLYHTGEILLHTDEELLKYVVAAPFRKLLKTVTPEELRKRYGIKEEEE